MGEQVHTKLKRCTILNWWLLLTLGSYLSCYLREEFARGHYEQVRLLRGRLDEQCRLLGATSVSFIANEGPLPDQLLQGMKVFTMLRHPLDRQVGAVS